MEDLLAAAKPLMDWLTDNHQPQIRVIVTANHAELVASRLMTKNI